MKNLKKLLSERNAYVKRKTKLPIEGSGSEFEEDSEYETDDELGYLSTDDESGTVRRVVDRGRHPMEHGYHIHISDISTTVVVDKGVPNRARTHVSVEWLVGDPPLLLLGGYRLSDH